MSTLEEKRVYSEKSGPTRLFVATGMGLAVVEVVADRVGEFSVVHRAPARDVSVADEWVAVAADEDVFVREFGRETFDRLEFGPATAVRFTDDGLLAAGADGRLARIDDDAWVPLAEVDAAVRAVDGDLLATEAGVYRLRDGSAEYAGLDAATDVSAAGVPLAATEDGLYKLGNGWMDVLDGPFRAVRADPESASAGRLGRAHAAGDALYAHEDGEWTRALDAELADVAYGPDAVYAVTPDGTLYADAGEGWRSRLLGLPDVRAVAVA